LFYLLINFQAERYFDGELDHHLGNVDSFSI